MCKMAKIDLWSLRRAARVIAYSRMILCPPESNFQRARQGVGALVVGQNLRVDIVLTGRSDTGIFVCFWHFLRASLKESIMAGSRIGSAW